MEGLRGISCDLRVLACSEDSFPAFAPLAEKAGFEIMGGPKEDVLRRYCHTIRRFRIDRLIRATGDNPFVFADAAGAIAREAAELNADYAGYAGLPHGAGVESVDARALLRAEQAASSVPDREHVCPYLYTHPEQFLLHRPLAPEMWRGPSVRITVDTPEDYRRAGILYGALTRIPAEKRYQGETIIRAYRESFGDSEPTR
jgi:spore coat polysaccharide biosynthesis protein SpsF